ncbi:MAG: cytochrome c, partial [Gemmatimonadetes bacterium]|nr:cytochrome c [Gemmatimonadota bacterium]
EGGPQTTGLPPAQDPAAGALVVSADEVPEDAGGDRAVPALAPAEVVDAPRPTPAQMPQLGQLPVTTGAGNPFMAPLSDEVLEQEGERIFLSSSCITCHAIAGTTAAGVVGPSLTMVGSRPWIGAGASAMNHENMVAWIRNPELVKPGTLMPGTRTSGGGMPPTGLTDQQVRAVAAYLLRLK